MRTRSLEPEILDRRRPSPEDLASTQDFLAWINRWLGGVRATRLAFEASAPSWTGPVRILDVATGGADIPRALIDWARATRRAVAIVALDRERDMLDLARARSADYPEISFVHGDVRDLPFAPRSFDYVTSSLLFHHLTDDGVIAALRAFDRIARRGIVVNDLLRRRRLFLWTKFFTFFSNPIVRYDGPLSVRKSFTPGELRSLAVRAGLGWLEARVRFGHRLLLAGERDPGK